MAERKRKTVQRRAATERRRGDRGESGSGNDRDGDEPADRTSTKRKWRSRTHGRTRPIHTVSLNANGRQRRSTVADAERRWQKKKKRKEEEKKR